MVLLDFNSDNGTLSTQRYVFGPKSCPTSVPNICVIDILQRSTSFHIYKG